MGVSSKIGTIALGVQTVKGTPAATPTVKMKLAGSPSLSPRRDTARYVTTDRGRDQGLAYVSQLRVEGDMPVYLHPDGFWLLMWGVLGAHTASGTAPNLTDTQVPANDVPWFTIWRMVADNLYEKFVDCKLVSMTVEGTAGSTADCHHFGARVRFHLGDLGHPLGHPRERAVGLPRVCGKIKIDDNAYPISRVQFSVDNNGSG